MAVKKMSNHRTTEESRQYLNMNRWYPSRFVTPARRNEKGWYLPGEPRKRKGGN